LFNIAKNTTAFRTGVPNTPEQRAKISATMKGRPGRKQSPEEIERMRRTKCYLYEGFIRPDGTQQSPISDLKTFCKENGLYYAAMSRVYNGGRPSHQGWTHINLSDDVRRKFQNRKIRKRIT
jgi:hypothetical protein